MTSDSPDSLVPVNLQDRMEDLVSDLGRVLHANTSTLIMVLTSLDVALKALGDHPFGDAESPSNRQKDEALRTPARALAKSLEAFLTGTTGRDIVAPMLRDELADYVELLNDFEEEIPVAESRGSTLRTVACRCQKILRQLKPGTFPRQLARTVQESSRDLERVTAQISLLESRLATLQMDYTIRSLREYITSDLRHTESKNKLSMRQLLSTTHQQLAELASTQGVQITPTYDADMYVVGIERELIRLFGNLLHNAIKYSWRRSQGKAPWVSVRVRRQQQQGRLNSRVVVEIENWGVPIGSEEISQGLVFQMGYRGKWSSDRGRLGTGIGLTDAYEIARAHQGDLAMTSRPAHETRTTQPVDETHPDYYQQPFVTTVTVSLPEAVRE